MKRLWTKLILITLVAGIAAAAASARGKADDSSSQTSSQSTTTAQGNGSQQVNTLIRSWPQEAQAAAEAMISRYGQPDDLNNIMVVWRDKSPFTRTVVFRDPVRHSFPVEHQDVLLQEINMQVPLNKVGDLVRFNGSLLIDRTKGTVASRCDRERHNLLSLNLANEIIAGKRNVDSARRFYADTVAKQMAGRSSPYTEKLMFNASSSGGDVDHPMLKEQGAPQDSRSMPDGSAPTTPPSRGY